MLFLFWSDTGTMSQLMRHGIVFVKNIDVEDLPYIERDLNFAQKVSLAFLLYGDQHPNAAYVLQKLLALANASSSAPAAHNNTDLLRQYANTNPDHWQSHLVEALTIINARRVLRKMGFSWQELRLHYLPHILEVTLHLHPLLKALYIICEQLTVSQSGRLVLDINDNMARRQTPQARENQLRFYDYAHLEIFLLDWLTRRVIELGDINAEGNNMTVLIEYFKFHDMPALAGLLIDTINSNATPTRFQQVENETDASVAPATPMPMPTAVTLTVPANSNDLKSTVPQRRLGNAFEISRDHPGIVLIVNQQTFHRNVEPELQHLLPRDKLPPRQGTDVDKLRLSQVFAALGYKVEPHDNLDHVDLLHQIREVCNRSLLCDSVIICILSHGFEGAVYGSNSIPLSISAIENVLCDNPHLRTKPKMLIIQACQRQQNSATCDVNAITKSPEQHVNMLKAMSTVPGFVALRDTSKGSWFIQSLCDAIVEHAASEHMLDILTHVICLVSNKRGDKNEVMVPTINYTLRRPFYLPKI